MVTAIQSLNIQKTKLTNATGASITKSSTLMKSYDSETGTLKKVQENATIIREGCGKSYVSASYAAASKTREGIDAEVTATAEWKAATKAEVDAIAAVAESVERRVTSSKKVEVYLDKAVTKVGTYQSNNDKRLEKTKKAFSST